MRTLRVILAVCAVTLATSGPAQDLKSPAQRSYTEIQRGPHHKIWERIELVPAPGGRMVERKHSYTELATGLHFKNERGEWEESKEEIEILPDHAGAVARQGQHKAIFPVEISTGLIELQTPEGQWLRSRVWGLAYFDAATGDSVLLAEVKASDGQVVGDNVVVYPDAFTDFVADLRYTYTRAGFEQDVVLREQPPGPDKFGLNPATTRLQVLTEFDQPPQPTQEPARSVQPSAGRAPADVKLGFGAMSIGSGKAFSVNAAGETGKKTPVGKAWGPIEGRDFLIEEVPYESVAEELRKLPQARAYEGARLDRRGTGESGLVALKALLPKRYAKAAPSTASKLGRMARVRPDSTPSFVMDYLIVTSQANYTFKGDTTYSVTGAINLSGTTTIEGGTVIKYGAGSSLNILGTVNCQTASYRPAVFTSVDDNTVGELLSSGAPCEGYQTLEVFNEADYDLVFQVWDASWTVPAVAGSVSAHSSTSVILPAGLGQYYYFEAYDPDWNVYYGYEFYPLLDYSGFTLSSDGWSVTYVENGGSLCTPGATPATALTLANGGSLRDLRFRNLDIAIATTGFLSLTNVQFLQCTNAIQATSCEFYAGNVLLSEVVTGFNGTSYSGTVEHMTYDQGTQITAGTGAISLTLTNSLITQVPNNGVINPTLVNSYKLASSTGVFQTVGGGVHYLATNSPYRNVGTTNLDAALLAGLRTKTTYPPVAYTNVTFTTAQTFNPQAQRDTDVPDLGYHYDPLDYSLGGCAARSNLTFTAGTVVGWFRTTSGWYHAGQGLRMIGNIVVSFAGTALEPTYFVRLNTVQENDRTAGFGHGGIENWEGPSIPIIRGRFLRCTVMANEVFDGYFAGDYGMTQPEMTHTEFWSGTLYNYGDYMRYTNCLMWRVGLGIANGATGRDHILRNCTMIGGTLAMRRQPYYGPSPVSIRDCSFDGTVITVNDYYSSNTTYTDYDHNAYTNVANPFPLGGGNDQRGVTFNWQTNWLGNYYLPGDSPLLNTGSRPADAVGLYHFTTQTDQTKEGISAVDIGYHYLGVDWEGKPWDENWDEVPDYVADPDGDGLADAWELLHFGDLSETGSLDYDGDGATNWDEFNTPTDPNSIAFTTRFDNLYVSNRVVAGTCELQTGHPHEMAVLINSNNLAGASWTAYTSNLSFTLPDADGDYLVLVALRGRVATNPPVTDYTELTLDRVPPLLVITNPVLTGAAATVVKPYLQLQGYADEPLGSYSYDLTNELGLATNELVAVVDQYFDTNRFDFTTNYFQAYDIELATNVNTIILRVADRAGNVTETNLVVTLDFAGDTNAPGLSLIWPTNDMHLSGDSFYLRGKIDDETASLTARIVNANGATNEAVGLVERNGMFWLEDLPLAAGTNTIELTATDAAGNVNTKSFNVVQSGVTLTIDSTPTGSALYEPTGTVYGTVSDPNYAVTVNGVAAEVDQLSGEWTATNVPNYGQGTSTFDAQATASGNPPAQVSRQEEQDPEVFVTEHHSSWAPGRGEHWEHTYSAQFEPDENGNRKFNYTGTATRRVTTEACAYTHTYRWSSSNDVLTVQQEGCGGDSEPTPVSSGSEFYWVKDAIGRSYDHSDSWTLGHSTHFVVHYFAKEVQHEFPNGDGTVTTVTVPAAHTQWKLFTGGKASVQKKNLFCLNASATEYNGRPQGAPWYCTPSDPVAASRIRVNGKRVGSDRLLYKMYPDNEPVTVTVQVPDAKHYDASVGASKHGLRIRASGLVLKPDAVVVGANFCVGQKMTFTPDWDSTPAGLDETKTTYEWKLPGVFVNESNQPCPTCSVNWTNNPALLTNQTTVAWWVSGGKTFPGESFAVNLLAHLDFTNGQELEIEAKGLLWMFRPIPSYYAVYRGSVDAGTNYLSSITHPGPFLHFGSCHDPYPTFGDSGIVLGYSNAPLLEFSTTQTHGRYYFTQIMESHIKRNVWTSGGCSGEQLDVRGLDNQNPMNARYGTKRSEIWHDGPGSPLGGRISWVSRSDSVEAYLMFEPWLGPERIAVPMAKVNWGWSGSAKTNSTPNGAQLIAGSPAELLQNETFSFPEWTNTIPTYGAAFTTNLPSFYED